MTNTGVHAVETASKTRRRVIPVTQALSLPASREAVAKKATSKATSKKATKATIVAEVAPAAVAPKVYKTLKNIRVPTTLLRDEAGEILWPKLGKSEKPLWPYQAQLVANTFKAFHAGGRRVMTHAPTGAGKTKTALHGIVTKMYEARKPVLIVAHTHELIGQLARAAYEAGIPENAVGIIDPGNVMDAGQELMVYVASLQSLVGWLKCRRAERQIDMGKFALVIIDEAHRATAASYDALFAENTPVLGLTGTPVRHSNGSLAKRFDAFVLGPSTAQLIRLGKLTPTRYVVPEQLLSDEDLRSGLKSGGMEYDDAKISKMMEAKADKVFGSVVRDWKRHGENRQTLAFAPSVVISRGLVARFKGKKVKAGHIDAQTPMDEREKLVADFVSGKLKVLSSVGVFVEGFDAPECSCIIGMRPTLSLIFHLQQGGRGIRAAEGKQDCVFLDFVGNVLNPDLGVVDRPQEWETPGWTLLDGDERKAKKLRRKVSAVYCACPKCREDVLIPLRRNASLASGGNVYVRVGQQTALMPSPAGGYSSRKVNAFHCSNGHEMYGTALPMTCAACSHHQQESDGTGLCPKCGSFDPNGHQSAWATTLGTEVVRVMPEELGMQFGGKVVDWADEYHREDVRRAQRQAIARSRPATPATAPQKAVTRAEAAIWFAGLQHISLERGHTTSVPGLRFKDRFGCTPTDMGVQHTAPAAPSDEVREWVKAHVRAWRARQDS